MNFLYSPLDQFYILPLEHVSKIVDFSFFMTANPFYHDIEVQYRWLAFIIGALKYGILDKQIYLHYPYIWLTGNISHEFLEHNFLENLTTTGLNTLIQISLQNHTHFISRDLVFNFGNYLENGLLLGNNFKESAENGSLGFLALWTNFVANSGELSSLYLHLLNYTTYVGAFSAIAYPSDFLFDCFSEIFQYNKDLGALYLNNIHVDFLMGNLDSGFSKADIMLSKWENDIKGGVLPSFNLIQEFFGVDGNLTKTNMVEAMETAENTVDTKFATQDKTAILNFLHTLPSEHLTETLYTIFANSHLFLFDYFKTAVAFSESNLLLVQGLNHIEEAILANSNISEVTSNVLFDQIASILDKEWMTQFFFKLPRSFNHFSPFETLYINYQNIEDTNLYFFNYAYNAVNDLILYLATLEYYFMTISNGLVLDSIVPSFQSIETFNNKASLTVLLTDNIFRYLTKFLGLNFSEFSNTSLVNETYMVMGAFNPYYGSLIENFNLFFFGSTLGLFSVVASIFLLFFLYNVIFVDVRHGNTKIIKDEYVKDTTFAQFLIPNYTRYIAEQLYRVLLTITLGNIAHKNARYFFPTIFLTFHVVLFFNLYGMLPLSFTFTSLFVVTFTMSLWLFVGLNIVGLYKNKTKFFGLFIPSNVPTVLIPFLVVLETISYFFRVISVSVRLFANMMAGHTLLKVLSTFVMGAVMNTSKISPVIAIIPLLLGTGLLVIIIGLEVAVAFIQAYVFTVLFSVYINDAIQGGH